MHMWPVSCAETTPDWCHTNIEYCMNDRMPQHSWECICMDFESSSETHSPLCEKSVSTFYCPSLSQTSPVGKVSVKLFHKLSKNTASRKPTKTSSLQAKNYQTTSAVSKTLPGFQTPNKTAKAQARSKVPLPSSTSG